jgi:4-carboxymuconolactone decarboxylase
MAADGVKDSVPKRVPELRPETMTEEQRNVAQEIISGPHGRLVGPYLAWLQCPDLARRARALSEYIRFRAALPRRLSELAILVTGRYWKAEFEFYAHRILGKQAGLDDSIIDAIAAGKRPPLRNPEDQIVYDLCTELYETHRVSDGLYARAVNLLTLPVLVELVTTIGYYSMVSMTLNTFQVGLPKGEPSPFRD